MDNNERARRHRARKRGENIPKLKPGPKKGYKQTREHIEKRKRFGSKHHAWKGGNASKKTGRTRAARLYPEISACEICGKGGKDRHHIDGDTKNNRPENVVFLCRRCHMLADGRLDEFIKLARKNQSKAVAARWD